MQHVGLLTPLEEVEGDAELVAATRAALEEGVHQLADTVRNSLNFYRMQESAETVERAVLTGPAVAIPGFVERLSEQLKLPRRARFVVVDGDEDEPTRPASPSPPGSPSKTASRLRARGRGDAPRQGSGPRRGTEASMTTAMGAVLAGIFGAIFGSFLNVVAYRLPRGESLVAPAVALPAAASTPIKPYDNVPVLSWLLLRGRCRHCKEPISARYPLVEAGTGLLCALVVVAKGADEDAILGLVARAAAGADHADRPRPPDHPQQAHAIRASVARRSCSSRCSTPTRSWST